MAKIKEEDKPENWSQNAIDLCNRLLKRKPRNRIGADSIASIKSHEWFSDINEAELNNFEAKAAFIPECKNNFDEADIINYKNHIEKKDKLASKDFSGYFFRPLYFIN